MANKPLVIDVDSAVIPNGSLDQWSHLGNTQKFISKIQTQNLSKDTNIASLVSGIPTAFARVDLFASAISAAASGNSDGKAANNLMGYYRQLVDEWRGFIACIGLDYTKIKVKRIELAYSDGRQAADTQNIYEPKGAFGNMLLERRDRWCDLNTAENEDSRPYINLIKYDDKVVGATAPESLLFTSSSYRVEKTDDRAWVDFRTGRFTDPLRSEITAEQAATLHAYVKHLLSRMPAMQAYYSGLPTELQMPTHVSIISELQRWLQDIENYATNHGFDIRQAAIPPVSAGFTGPFADLFKFEDKLYGIEGQISEQPTDLAPIGFDPKKLLLPASARIARVHLRPEYSRNLQLLNRLPVYVLTAEKKGTPGEYAFFALPLSASGLNVYGKTIGALVGMGNAGTVVSSRLSAVYDPSISENNLEVTLSIQTIEGKHREYREVYTTGNDDGLRNKDILIWPNFISRQWNRYYLFSELPHNSTTQTYAAFPFVGDTDDTYFRVMTDADSGAPLLLAERGEITAPRDMVDAKLLVRSTTEVANNAYKYEIYESNKPFKGVRLLSPTGNEGGYLLINYSTDPASDLPRDLLGRPKTLQHVNVGIDFGSTNTSIAYSSNTGSEEGFEFTNQRVSLFGNELPGAPSLPRENQIFFFQGSEKPVQSNAIKSVLTLHDELRLPPLANGEDNIMRLGKEVVGGFPSFANNLPVKDVNEEYITLEYPGIGMVTQAHNMKWNNPEEIGRASCRERV